MNRAVRIGFIGCGSHATQNIYPAFRLGVTVPGEPIGELVACCDLDADRARHNAQVFGFKSWYTDYHQMLDQEDLDCVFAVMPTRPQTQIAIECLNAGLPVFVEKPAAATLEDAYAVKDACARSGKFLMVGFMKRFSTPYLRAKQLMADKRFGTPASFESRYNFGAYATVDQYDFLNGFSCHVFDLARFFMGEVASVYAMYASHAGREDGLRTYSQILELRETDITHPQEEAWMLGLQFESGAAGFLQTNCLERVQERVVVTGRGSWVVVDDWRRITAFMGNQEEPYTWEPHDQLPSDLLDFRTIHGYTGEVREFVRGVRNSQAPTPSIDDTIAHLKIEMAAKASAKSGQPVLVSEIA